MCALEGAEGGTLEFIPDCADLEEDGFGREPWFQCLVVEEGMWMRY